MLARSVLCCSLFPVLAGFLAAGCSDSGGLTDDLDPADFSVYLFAGQADRTVVKPDPGDPKRDLVWEFRNILRVQSFLAKSCTRDEQPSCRHLVLGYTEYRLDGSVEIALSAPGLSMGGLRAEDALTGFQDTSQACVAAYFPDGSTIMKGACTEDLVLLLATHLAIFQLEGVGDPECLLLSIGALACTESRLGGCEAHLTQVSRSCAHVAEYLMTGCWGDNCGEEACYDPAGCHDLAHVDIERDLCGFTVGAIAGLNGPTDNRLDGYSCASELDESGPESIYPFVAERDGAIYVELVSQNASKPDGEAGDLDLFLLRDCGDANTCTQGGQDWLFASVEKGHCYYLVVDGFQGARGPHELRVTYDTCPARMACTTKACGDPCHWKSSGSETGVPDGICDLSADCVPVDLFDASECRQDDLEWVFSSPAGVEFNRSEVTVAQYAKCVTEDKCSLPGLLRNRIETDCNWRHHDRNDYPVNCVSQRQARDFCQWAGARLPSNDEWTAEASASGTRTYPWGEEEPSCRFAIMNSDWGRTYANGCGQKSTWPICSRISGNSVSGLCDMGGALWEWVEREGCMRGASWINYYKDTFESDELGFTPRGENPETNIGFRCVRPRP